MKIYRSLLLLGAFLFAVASHSAGMSARQKDEILAGVENVIINKAFLPSVDFSKWPDYLAKHRIAIDKARTQGAFTEAVNQTLFEFGFSHLRLQSDKTRLEPSVPSSQTVQTDTGEALTWAQPNCAILRISTFKNPYNRKNVEALLAKASCAKYLILDLRNNGGGAIASFSHLLDNLLPPDTVVGTFINRVMVDSYVKATKSAVLDPVAIAHWSKDKLRTKKGVVPSYSGSIAVLINGKSGSAAEIVAAALRENVGAKIVGAQSAGAVLASVYARLPEGFKLQYPISDYVTKLGCRLEGNPIQPDVRTPSFSLASGDRDIMAAISCLCESTPILPVAQQPMSVLMPVR